VIAALIMMSIVLTASVLYPEITGGQILWILGGGSVLFVIGTGITLMIGGGEGVAADRPEYGLRRAWRMPPLDTLQPARMSLSKGVWMAVLRGYLVLAVGMVVVRIVQLALAPA